MFNVEGCIFGRWKHEAPSGRRFNGKFASIQMQRERVKRKTIFRIGNDIQLPRQPDSHFRQYKSKNCLSLALCPIVLMCTWGWKYYLRMRGRRLSRQQGEMTNGTNTHTRSDCSRNEMMVLLRQQHVIWCVRIRVLCVYPKEIRTLSPPNF